MRLEVWVPTDPVRTGDWLPVTVRVTNVGARSVGHAGDPRDPACQQPVGVRLEAADLFGLAPEFGGNASLVAEEFLRHQWPAAISVLNQPTGPFKGLCIDRSTLGPGESFTSELAAIPLWVWRDQPLPSGSAAVSARFEWWRPASASPLDPEVLNVEVPVTIEGRSVGYPSPQGLLESVLGAPGLAEWLASRDLGEDWNMNVVGIEPPAGSADWAAAGYEGGPAPEETVQVEIAAEGTTHGGGTTPTGIFEVTLDPWTAVVTGAELK